MRKFSLLLIISVILFALVSCGNDEDYGTNCQHSFVVLHAVEPGCVTQGWTDGIYCSICDTELQKQRPIAAKGHNFVNGKCICGAEEGVQQIIVSSTSTIRGGIVDVAVSLNGNPDIASLILSLEFDNDALTLEKITYSDEVGGCTMLPEENESPVKLYWISAIGDMTGDFTLATLRFKVNNNAAKGDYAVDVTYNPENVFNFDEENVLFEVVDGKITVE